MQAFCPKCGTETGGIGSRGLCADCYAEENDLLDVPDRLETTVCPHCGRTKIGPDWVEIGGERDLIYEVLDDSIAGEHVVAVRFVENDDPNAPQKYDIGVLVERTVDGATMQNELETALVVDEEQCEQCAKFQGGHFKYIIQLRTDTGDVPEEALGALMDTAAEVTNRSRDHFIADVQENDHGYDIYASTRKMAEELVQEVEQAYDVEKQRSKELVGEEEGQRVYRTVISARITGHQAPGS
jgi:nonsense-mediated mRNA decay protein 3